RGHPPHDRAPSPGLHHGPAGEDLDDADYEEEPPPGMEVGEQDVRGQDFRVRDCRDAVDDVEEADEEQQDPCEVEPAVPVDLALQVDRSGVGGPRCDRRPKRGHQLTAVSSALLTPIAIRSAGWTHASARWNPPASRIASRRPIAQRWSSSAIAAAVPGGIASSTYHISLASKTWPPSIAAAPSTAPASAPSAPSGPTPTTAPTIAP